MGDYDTGLDNSCMGQNGIVGDDEIELCPNSTMFLWEYLWIVSNKIAEDCPPEQIEAHLLSLVNNGLPIQGLVSGEDMATGVQAVVDDPFTVFHQLLAEGTIAGRINLLLAIPMVDAENIEMFARNLGMLEGYDLRRIYDNSVPAPVHHCGPKGTRQ